VKRPSGVKLGYQGANLLRRSGGAMLNLRRHFRVNGHGVQGFSKFLNSGLASYCQLARNDLDDLFTEHARPLYRACPAAQSRGFY
jgi:hypothetical protein